MITLLETLVDGADGSYASKQDLRNLEHAMFAWSERKEAYLAVQANEKSIIDRAMKLLQESKTFSDDRPIADAAARGKRSVSEGNTGGNLRHRTRQRRSVGGEPAHTTATRQDRRQAVR